MPQKSCKVCKRKFTPLNDRMQKCDDCHSKKLNLCVNCGDMFRYKCKLEQLCSKCTPDEKVKVCLTCKKEFTATNDSEYCCLKCKKASGDKKTILKLTQKVKKITESRNRYRRLYKLSKNKISKLEDKLKGKCD